jgi:hypothetical protein
VKTLFVSLVNCDILAVSKAVHVSSKDYPVR